MSYPNDPRHRQQQPQYGPPPGQYPPTQQWPQQQQPQYGAPYGQQSPVSAAPMSATPFGAPPMAPPPPPRKKSGGGKVALVIVAIVAIICVGIGAIMYAVGSKTTPPTSTAADTTTGRPTQAAPQSQPAAPAAPQQPKTIYKLTGKGIKKTAKFSTPDEWTLKYTYDCSKFGGTGNFIVMEYAGDGTPTDALVNELDKKGNDSVPQHNDGGSHYLEVNSECSWTITVVG